MTEAAPPLNAEHPAFLGQVHGQVPARSGHLLPQAGGADAGESGQPAPTLGTGVRQVRQGKPCMATVSIAYWSWSRALPKIMVHPAHCLHLTASSPRSVLVAGQAHAPAASLGVCIVCHFAVLLRLAAPWPGLRSSCAPCPTRGAAGPECDAHLQRGAPHQWSGRSTTTGTRAAALVQGRTHC